MRAPGERGQRTLESVVGEYINNVYGRDLYRYCHFDKEPSILTLLLKSMSAMEVDLRGLLGGAPAYDTKKHVRKLRLQNMVPGLADSDSSDPDKFLRTFAWKAANGTVMSEGFGVNMWALLLMVSMMGSKDIHCKQSNRVANSVMSQILRLAPSGATPGNMIPVRGFNERSHNPESVMVSSHGRPEHFIRPINDDNLAINGRFSYCQLDDGDMPEDYLGLGGPRSIAKFLKCKYWEIPPQYIHCQIQLMQGRYYCIRKHSEVESQVLLGTLYIDKDGVHVMYDDRGHIWAYGEWQRRLRDLGFVVLPTVARSGAVVKYETAGGETRLGCLVPNGTRAAMVENGDNIPNGGYVANFDHLHLCYHALVEDGALLPMPVLKTLESLVPPGTVLWIKADSHACGDMKDKGLLRPADNAEEEEDARMVKARLNIPLSTVRILFAMCCACRRRWLTLLISQTPKPGTVYVTVLQRSAIHSRDVSYRHFEVDPWELSITAPEPHLRVEELMLPLGHQ